MEKFAGYGFNKSHAAAYALVAYQTAYFRRTTRGVHGGELSLVMDDTDKVRSLYADAVEQGLEILPPDVNASACGSSRWTRSASATGSADQGHGEQAIASVVARAPRTAVPRPVRVLPAVDKRLANRRVIEALVKAGAFDSIDPRRATLFASVGVAIEAAEHAEASATRYRCSATGRRRPWSRSSPPASGPTPSASRTRNGARFYVSDIPSQRMPRSSRRS